MNMILGEEELSQLFRSAQTHRSWRAERMTDDLPAAVDDLAKWETATKSNLPCNLGYGDGASLRPRAGRLDFSEACRIL